VDSLTKGTRQVLISRKNDFIGSFMLMLYIAFDVYACSEHIHSGGFPAARCQQPQSHSEYNTHLQCQFQL